jgi:hypothetical protein
LRIGLVGVAVCQLTGMSVIMTGKFVCIICPWHHVCGVYQAGTCGGPAQSRVGASPPSVCPAQGALWSTTRLRVAVPGRRCGGGELGRAGASLRTSRCTRQICGGRAAALHAAQVGRGSQACCASGGVLL